jgi:hypothetical protein
MKPPEVAKIVEIGLTYPEIGNQQIMELFDISGTYASQMKKQVQREMVSRGIYTWNPKNVNTKIAFEVWGINLEQAEKAYRKLKQLDMLKEEPT